MAGKTNLFQSRSSRYAALVRPHIHSLYRMAWRWTRNREDAEDLVQDVLIKLVDKVDEMQAIERLRPWLIKVLYRRYVDVFRRRARSPIERHDAQKLDALAADDADAIGQLELRQLLVQALETLDDGQRDVILMHDVEGYTAAEIADVLDISVGTVKSRLHRGRDRLKKILADGTF